MGVQPTLWDRSYEASTGREIQVLNRCVLLMIYQLSILPEGDHLKRTRRSAV